VSKIFNKAKISFIFPYHHIGVIPAGSTDTIAYCLHGTTDIKTCIIHIVLGQTTGFDISSVSSDKKLLKFYASVVAYGYLGDIAYDNDNYRFLGPKRYEYVGLKKFLNNRGYDAELYILQDSNGDCRSNSSQTYDESNASTTDCDNISRCNNNNIREVKCYENCSVCSTTTCTPPLQSQSTFSVEDEKYKRISGKFLMVNAANISCACDRSPAGFSPYCHLGDGNIDIILVRHGSYWQNIKLLTKLAGAKGQVADLPFVELYRTKKFHFKALNSSSVASLADSMQPITIGPNKYCSVWNCDGEVLQETDITVR
jgi:ceramide kinase